MCESFRDFLIRHRQLADRIVDFNLRPNRYLHSQRRAELERQLPAKRLESHPRSECFLSRYVLQRLGLNDQWCFDFGEPIHRIALADSVSLEHFTFLTGVTLRAREIAAVTQRKQLTRLRGEIGDDAYQFALYKAPFLLGPLHTSLPDSPLSLDTLKRTGRQCLQAVLSDAPNALLRRLELKFAEQLNEDDHLPIAEKGRWSRFLIKLFTREVDPSWQPLFN